MTNNGRRWVLVIERPMRDADGNLRALTLIWANTETGEERTVRFSGVDLRYVKEAA
jgi:hypothetical protein